MESLPDEEWYASQSRSRKLPHHCPLASITGCPRYFASVDHAQRASVLSGEIPVKIRDHLLKKWESSDALAIDDHYVGTSYNSRGVFSGVSNFCPEVAGTIAGLYCSDFAVHSDEPKRFSLVRAKHYTSCREFSVLGYEEKLLSPVDRGITPQKRFTVFQRDNFTCVYCGQSAPDVLLHIDHKISRADGGGNEVSNLVTACSVCNNGKSSASVI